MAAPSLPSDVYAVFTGNIDQAALQRIVQGFTTASANKVKRVHLLFQSSGGFVGDGVFLYNFFKSLPLDLIIYNGGAVLSIAVIAYLGAKERKASAHASFMIHRTFNFPQSATAAQLKSHTESTAIDDRRTESILKGHVNLSTDQWADLNNRDLVFSAEDAVKIGLADEISEFRPPAGVQIYNV